MTRGRGLLVNASEVATDDCLREAASRWGLRVCPKVGVADALGLRGVDLPRGEYGYALKAHFDFVVVEGRHAAPLLAVEFDGAYHATDPDQIARDGLKASLCLRFGLPLMRISWPFLRRIGDTSTLGFVIESWLAHKRSPEDPPTSAVLSPDAAARGYLWQRYDAGVCTTPEPRECWVAPWTNAAIPRDASPTVYAFVDLVTGQRIVGHASMPNFRAGYTSGWDLAERLAVIEVAERLRRFEEGGLAATAPNDVADVGRLIATCGATSGWPDDSMRPDYGDNW
jgi:hypothetical protein